MAEWNISPTGVASVLKAVGDHADELGDELEHLGAHVEAAATATQSNLIGQTLSDYFTQTEGPRLSRINTRVSASCTGVTNATKAYLQGDEEMAATAQQAAIKAGTT